MLSFKRDGDKVEVLIDHGIYCSTTCFSLKINQNFDYQARLLTEQLQKHMNNELERLKRKYYEEGWKEAKGKKNPKRKDFYGGWEK